MSTSFFLLFGCMALAFAAFTYFMFNKFIFSNYKMIKNVLKRLKEKSQDTQMFFITVLVSRL